VYQINSKTVLRAGTGWSPIPIRNEHPSRMNGSAIHQHHPHNDTPDLLLRRSAAANFGSVNP